jgi:hypothetical protein
MESLSRIEGISKGLHMKLHGDTGTWNVNRLLRVPGTYNNKRFLKQRVEILKLAKDLRYDIGCFEKYYVETKNLDAEIADVTFSTNITECNLDDLNVSDKVRALILRGWDRSSGFKSRSEADQHVIYKLIRSGCSYDTIRAIFSSKQVGIASKCLEEVDRCKDMLYLKRSIASAEALIKKQKSKGCIKN